MDIGEEVLDYYDTEPEEGQLRQKTEHEGLEDDEQESYFDEDKEIPVDGDNENFTDSEDTPSEWVEVGEYEEGTRDIQNKGNLFVSFPEEPPIVRVDEPSSSQGSPPQSPVQVDEPLSPQESPPQSPVQVDEPLFPQESPPHSPVQVDEPLFPQESPPHSPVQVDEPLSPQESPPQSPVQVDEPLSPQESPPQSPVQVDEPLSPQESPPHSPVQVDEPLSPQESPPQSPVQVDKPLSPQESPPQSPVQVDEPLSPQESPPHSPVQVDEPLFPQESPPQSPVQVDEPLSPQESPPHSPVQVDEPLFPQESPPQSPVQVDEPLSPPESPLQVDDQPNPTLSHHKILHLFEEDERDAEAPNPKRKRLISDEEDSVVDSNKNYTSVKPVDMKDLQEVNQDQVVLKEDDLKEVTQCEASVDEEIGNLEGNIFGGSREEGEDEDYEARSSEDEDKEEELVAELADLEEDSKRTSSQEVEEEDVEEYPVDDEPSQSKTFVSDFDMMLERRKKAMSRSRKRRNRDINITASDDVVSDMIQKMKHCAEEDRRLNLSERAATKKLTYLTTVSTALKKPDVAISFIDLGGLEAFSEWLGPLPDHSLPNMKIRETLLDLLKTFPPVDNHALKVSRIGKAVMLLYKHPKETRKLKEKAGKLIQEWARPIFGLATNLKTLSKEDREKRDYSNLSSSARKRLGSTEEGQSKTGMEMDGALKPGDQGWIGRARVPMPSNKDYVVRPKWNVEMEFVKSSKKTMGRYDKQLQRWRETKKTKGSSKAAKLSISGNKMEI